MKKDQASSTAFTVAQGVLYIAGHSKQAHLVSEEMKTATVQILSSSEQGQKRLRQLNSYITRFVPLLEKLTLPGITLHYVLRKRYIENCAQQAIQDGAKQVIVLGAGFDTLAFRFSKQYPNVNFVEVDHPATHGVKRQALEAQEEKRNNLHFIPVDFTTQRLEDVLSKSPLVKPELPTLVIVEGVLMYLTTDQVQHLFASLPMFLHAGRRVVFTAVKPGSTTYGPLLKLYLKIKKEPLKWACETHQMEAFLQEVDYELRMLAGLSEFKKAFLSADYQGMLNDVEYIAIAEQGWPPSN